MIVSYVPRLRASVCSTITSVGVWAFHVPLSRKFGRNLQTSTSEASWFGAGCELMLGTHVGRLRAVTLLREAAAITLR